MQTLVVIPTYNEAENIEPLIVRLLELDEDLDVCVVDDASPDGTGEIVDRLREGEPRVHVVHRPGKLGLGGACCAGMLHGLEHGARFVVTMDADFSHDPGYLPALLAGMRDNDVMIGSRYVAGGGVANWGFGRRVLSRTANFVARAVLGLAPRDCTAGFRCYAREVLERIDPTTVKSNGYSYLEEMMWYCQRAGFRIGETPIVFVDRRAGRSKISRAEIFKAVGTLLRLRLSRLPERLRRP